MLQRVILLFLLLCAAPVGALETILIELREGATSDGVVVIRREDGHLVFEDAHTTAPLRLVDLAASGAHHAELAGLDGDDHPQYLNPDRHADAHDAAFNDALAISPDVAGNVTIGAHATDDSIHLRRGVAESIAGTWNFANGVLVSGAPVRVSVPGGGVQAAVRFGDASSPAVLSWSPSTQGLVWPFAFNADSLQGNTIAASVLTVSDGLVGSVLGEPRAVLEGFTTIEGIAAGNLLARSADETITGAWSFDSPVTLDRTTWQWTAALGAPATHSGWSIEPQGLLALAGNLKIWAALPLSAGDRLTALGITYTADGVDDGVTLSLLARDEATPDATFTTVAGPWGTSAESQSLRAVWTLDTPYIVPAETSVVLLINTVIEDSAVFVLGWGVQSDRRVY